MTRRTTLVLTVGLAVVVLWSLAGWVVADQRHRAEDPHGWPRSSSVGNGSSGGHQHTEISNGKIAFIRHSDIHVMNSDGTGQMRLTRIKAGVEGAVWPLDGKKIAFSARERYLDIYVIDAASTTETNLTRTKASSEGAPSWSPDGKKVAFIRTTRVVPDKSASSSAVPATGPSGLYVMKPDGTGLRKLSKGIPYSRSPNGKKIAFAAVHYRGELDIYVIDADGTGQTNLTSTETVIEDEPSWSPDGKQIAFTRADAGDVYVAQDVYLMNADGTGRSRLATGASSPPFTPRDR